MPYITDLRKKELAVGNPAVTPGDLTYLITIHLINAEFDEIKAVCDKYLANGHNNYATRCEVIGALSCATYEFHRRQQPSMGRMVKMMRIEIDWYTENVAPYEDEKIKQNGDVYQ